MDHADLTWVDRGLGEKAVLDIPLDFLTQPLDGRIMLEYRGRNGNPAGIKVAAMSRMTAPSGPS
jgi:hypothetical protein